MALVALPHIRRPSKRPAAPTGGTNGSTTTNHDHEKSNKSVMFLTHHVYPYWSAKSVVLVVVVGTILLTLQASVRQSHPGGAAAAAAVTTTKANVDDDPTKPPLGSESFATDGDGGLCRSSSSTTKMRSKKANSNRCTLLHPAADVSNHVKDEAVDRTVQIKTTSGGATAAAAAKSFRYTSSDNETGNAAAVLTRRGAGIGHDVNQDRSFILQLPGGEGDFIMGIFDGHGDQGHVTSHYVSSRLPAILSRAIATKAPDDEVAIRQILRDAFLQVDSDVDAFGAPFDMSMSGCTANVALRRGNRLFVANTGDSLAFVVSSDRSTGTHDIVYMTSKHKPDFPEERARVEGAGGKVYEPPLWATGDSPRVLSPLTKEEEEAGVLPFGLAMSRSIGDRELKDTGVIADPTIDVVDLGSLKTDNADIFVVAATDGLYDHVVPEELAAHLGKALHGDESTSQPLLLSAMKEMIMKASKVWLELMRGEVYRDDITIAVAKVV